MELADLPGHPARAAARTHKAMVEDLLAEMFRKVGVPAYKKKAREIYLLLEGATCLILIHGDHGYANAAAEAAKKLLSEPAKTRRR